MALDRIIGPLTRLLEGMIADTPNTPFAEGYHRLRVVVPSDLAAKDELGGYEVIYMDEPVGEVYRRCLEIMREENVEGDLEHYPERALTQLLDRVASEAFKQRKNLTEKDALAWAGDFVAQNAVSPKTWEVVWQIRHLKLPTHVEAADATFFPFDQSAFDDWFKSASELGKQYGEKALNTTFARVTVRAGSKENAIRRARPLIDDALHVLRIAAGVLRFARTEQRRQRRGHMRFAREQDIPGVRFWGTGIEDEPYELLVGEGQIDSLQAQCFLVGTPLRQGSDSKLQQRIARSVRWIGSSITRSSYDDALVDLCTALEALLTEKHDPRKAETIAARYLLLLLTEEGATYVTHPLSLYLLYLARNDVVHGSDWQVASKDDVQALRGVALDVLKRINKLLGEHPEITKHRRLLDLLEEPSRRQLAVEIVQRLPNQQDEAIVKVKEVLSSTGKQQPRCAG